MGGKQQRHPRSDVRAPLPRRGYPRERGCAVQRRWGQRIIRRLTRLPNGGTAAIEALQPYNGCNWTKALRDISNPDKHRNITSFFGDMPLKVLICIGNIDEAFESAPGTVSRARHPMTGEEV